MHVSQKPPLMDFFFKKNIYFIKKKILYSFLSIFEKICSGDDLIQRSSLGKTEKKVGILVLKSMHDRDSNAPSLTLVLHGEQTCLKWACLEGLLIVQWMCTSWDKNGNDFSVILHILKPVDCFMVFECAFCPPSQLKTSVIIILCIIPHHISYT